MARFGPFICSYGHVIPTAIGEKLKACPVCLQMTRARIGWASSKDKLPRKVSPRRLLHRRVREAIMDRFKAGDGVGELAADYLTIRPVIEGVLRDSLRRQRR